MSSPPMEKLQKLTTCGQCTKTLQQPVRLPCMHHVCKTCTDKLEVVTKDGIQGITCPICSLFTTKEVMSEDATMHKFIDLYIKQKAPSFQVLPCELCPKEYSGKRCVECKINLCDDCSIRHPRIPSCKGHIVKSISDIGSSNLCKINCSVFCVEHPNKVIEFNCSDCNKAICTECKILNHDKHGTDKISDAIVKLLPELEKKLQPITAKTRSLTNKIKKLTNLDEQIKHKGDQLIYEIEDRRDFLTKKLEDDADTLIGVVKDKHNNKRLEVNQYKTTAMNRLSSIDGIETWTSSVIEYMEDVNLLQQLQGDLSTMLGEPQVPDNPLVLKGIKMEFQPSNVTGNIIGNINNKLKDKSISKRKSSDLVSESVDPVDQICQSPQPTNVQNKDELKGLRPNKVKCIEITPGNPVLHFQAASQSSMQLVPTQVNSNVLQLPLTVASSLVIQNKSLVQSLVQKSKVLNNSPVIKPGNSNVEQTFIKPGKSNVEQPKKTPSTLQKLPIPKRSISKASKKSPHQKSPSMKAPVSSANPSDKLFQNMMKQVNDAFPVLRHVPDEQSPNMRQNQGR